MNINEAKNIIKIADNCGHVPLLEAVHGVGKSHICATYAKETGLHYEPLILSLMDTGDLLGIPETVKNNGLSSTVWAAPSWYNRIVNAAWPKTVNTDDLTFNDKGFKKYFESKCEYYGVEDTVTREFLNSIYSEYYNLSDDTLQLLRQTNVEYKFAKRSMLFLDEMNRSAPDILNASLQLILDKRLNDHVLPIVHGKETLVVAAINPAEGGYTVSSFDPALLDRFVHAKIEPSTSEWLEWARNNGVNKAIVDFIINNPDKLHFTPKDETKKGASSRSWTRLSTYLNTLSSIKDADVSYVLGTVGDTVGAEFVSFIKEYSSVLTIEDIEAIVKKHPIIKDVRKMANYLKEEVEDMEAIKRIELAKQLEDKYIHLMEELDDSDKEHNKKVIKEAMPYLAYLHALPLESFASYLPHIKSDSYRYTGLAALDAVASNKQLFRQIVDNLK